MPKLGVVLPILFWPRRADTATPPQPQCILCRSRGAAGHPHRHPQRLESRPLAQGGATPRHCAPASPLLVGSAHGPQRVPGGCHGAATSFPACWHLWRRQASFPVTGLLHTVSWYLALGLGWRNCRCGVANSLLAKHIGMVVVHHGVCAYFHIIKCAWPKQNKICVSKGGLN